MKRELSLESLREVDNGKIEVQFNKQVEKAINDCLNRPGDKRPRTVSVAAVLVPEAMMSPTGIKRCSGIKLTCLVKATVPDERSEVTTCSLKGTHGKVEFDPESPDDPHQATFADLGKVRGEVVRTAAGDKAQAGIEERSAARAARSGGRTKREKLFGEGRRQRAGRRGKGKGNKGGGKRR